MAEQDSEPRTEGAAAPLVDLHAHAMPLPVLKWAAEQGWASLEGLDDDYLLLDPLIAGTPAGARLPLPPSQYDAARRLREMDELGVEVAAVSLAPFLLAAPHPDVEVAIELVRRGNEALAEWCDAAPDRLVAIPSVPLGVAESAGLLAAVGADRGPGIALGTSGGGCELDDERHEVLWAEVAARNLFVFLHPSGVSSPPRHADYWMTQLVGYPAETALAVSRLMFSGVLARHAIRWVLAHGGGCLGSIRGRLNLGWERKPQARTVPQPPTEYLDALLYDTAVFDPATLGHLAATVGVDHLVVGTDWPFELADRDPAGTVTALAAHAGPGTAAQLRRTALELLGRPVN